MLGSDAATVFGAAGGTIASGTSTIIDGATGKMSVQLGASGTVNITDAHRTGSPATTRSRSGADTRRCSPAKATA